MHAFIVARVLLGALGGLTQSFPQNAPGSGGSSISTPVSIANGGTGASTQQAALDAVAGATTSTQYLRGNGTHVSMSAIQAGDVPTLNQNTTGTAAGLSATLAIGSGGTGQVTAQAAIDALLPAQTSANGKFLTSNGTTSSWGTVSSGATTVATFSGSSQANGASISGANITFGPADGTNPGMVTTGAQTLAGSKTFSSVIVSSVASNGHSLESPLSVKICLDGSACSSYLYRLSGDAVYLASSFNMNISASNQSISLNTGNNSGVIVDNTSNNALTLKGSSTGNAVSAAAIGSDTDISFNLIPKGAGALKNNADPIPAVHHAQTTAQVSMEYGICTLSTGSCSPSFAAAFSAAPACVCSEDGTTVTAGCAVGTPGTSSFTITTLTTAVKAHWQCIGAR